MFNQNDYQTFDITFKKVTRYVTRYKKFVTSLRYIKGLTITGSNEYP